MIFQHPIQRGVPCLLGLVAMLAFTPGCLFSPDEDKDDRETRAPERNSVAGAIALYTWVWEHKDLARYDELLHDGFEYWPYIDPNQDDFPWMPGDFWERTDEIGMARNMFDEEFVDPDPNDNVPVSAVESIKMTLSTLSQQEDVDGGTLVRVHADALVMWDVNNGASSDVYFNFLIVADPDQPGLFQIKKQTEDTGQ